MSSKLNRSIQIIAIVAVVFGLMTIVSGGSVLFFTNTFQKQVGNFVPIVVWFNFFIGFAYVIVGCSLWSRKSVAVWGSFFIVCTSLFIFVVLVAHILQGGLYEVRTVFAMIFRIVMWTLIALFSYHHIIHKQDQFENPKSLN